MFLSSIIISCILLIGTAEGGVILDGTYVLSLQQNGENFALATIIHPQFLLASWNAMKSKIRREIHAVAYVNGNSTKYAVKDFRNYDRTSDKSLNDKSREYHDVVVIQIHDEFTFGPTTDLNSLIVPRQGYEPIIGRTGKVLFFDDKKVLSYKLFTIYGNCSSIYGGKNGIHEGEFCAGDGNTRDCQNDLGLPLIDGLEIAGFSSWSISCNDEGYYPFVFTSVGYYSKWINSTINFFLGKDRERADDTYKPLLTKVWDYLTGSKTAPEVCNYGSDGAINEWTCSEFCVRLRAGDGICRWEDNSYDCYCERAGKTLYDLAKEDAPGSLFDQLLKF